MDVLHTQRLTLRPFSDSDIDDFFAYASNPLVGPPAGWKPHESKVESRKILHDFVVGDAEWAVVENESGKVIGAVGMHPDGRRNYPEVRNLGYVLDSHYWGRGYVPEAVTAAIQYAFEVMNLEVLSINHYPFNDKSRRVIEKCGFVYEGTVRRACKIYDGSIQDHVCYSILKQEYLERQKN